MKDFWFSIDEKGDEKKEKNIETAEADSDSTAKNRVESLNNDIYFYSEVSRTNCLTLNKKLHDLGNKYINVSNMFELVIPIHMAGAFSLVFPPLIIS